jgi:hypothetical protein
VPKGAKVAARFIAGTRVRVKRGVTDPDFPDLPLGGWRGTVREIDRRGQEAAYLVEWDEGTLQQAHPAYRRRCERDGLEHQSMWLGENDIEPDAGEALAMEQPREIRVRPLSESDEEDRIRMALGLTSEDPIPEVGEDTLRAYHQYLAGRLSFPFAAEWSEETGPLEDSTYLVQVTGLAGADEGDESCGLLCRARRGRETVVLPLADVEVEEGSPNGRLIEDYSTWFWNFGA